jgi:hypothetical protein
MDSLSQRNPCQLSETELVQYYDQIAPAADTMAAQAKPLEWLIPGMIPRESLIVVGGPAKLGRKSLLLMHLAMAVADDRPTGSYKFLGKVSPAIRGHCLLVNLEDGEARMARRLHQYGVRRGLFHELRVCYDRRGLGLVEEVAKRIDPPPILIIVDPLVELGITMPNFDENAAGDMAALMQRYRDLAQATKASIMLVHHLRKTGDALRGSGALEGAVDGWFMLFYQGSKRPRRLQWTLRDGSEGEADVNIECEGETIAVTLDGKVRREHTPVIRPPQIKFIAEDDGKEEKGQKKKKEKKRKEPREEVSYEEVKRRVFSAVREAEQPLSKGAIVQQAGVGRTRGTKAVNELIDDGEIVMAEGGNWTWNGID